jgi:hypothetical protein
MAMAGRHAVKVLSPEMLSLLDCAQALCIAEGNTLRRGKGECRGGTRGRRPVRASHDVVTITREIHGALPRGSMPVRAEEARKAKGAVEVGSPNSTDEAW